MQTASVSSVSTHPTKSSDVAFGRCGLEPEIGVGRRNFGFSASRKRSANAVRVHVRFKSKSEVTARRRHVRFTPATPPGRSIGPANLQMR